MLCQAEKKIPIIELRFVRAQRDKTGSLSTHMMSSVDKEETKRQEAATARQEEKRKKEERRKTVIEEKERQNLIQRAAAEMFINDESQVEASSETVECRTKKQYNTKDISNVALASLRHHTGLRETTEIATAAWIDAGLIMDTDTHLGIDHDKIRRAQERVMTSLQESFEADVTRNGVCSVRWEER